MNKTSTVLTIAAALIATTTVWAATSETPEQFSLHGDNENVYVNAGWHQGMRMHRMFNRGELCSSNASKALFPELSDQLNQSLTKQVKQHSCDMPKQGQWYWGHMMNNGTNMGPGAYGMGGAHHGPNGGHYQRMGRGMMNGLQDMPMRNAQMNAYHARMWGEQVQSDAMNNMRGGYMGSNNVDYRVKRMTYMIENTPFTKQQIEALQAALAAKKAN